ncbi:MAG: hypothetical protein KA748_07550 [Halomonas sp.]|nr:hypothetical protein [Halomonas sp.]MBP5980047.1 hypothetical protein [Halomonas sp.]
MTIIYDAEQRFAAQASRYTRRAYQAVLQGGQTVVEIVDGDLVETSTDDSIRFLKSHRLSIRSR